MQIVKQTFKKRGEEIVPFKKEVLTKIDEHHYIRQHYIFHSEGGWMDSTATTYFDGEKPVNGVVCYCHDVVDDKFNLMIKYEGCKMVESTEGNSN